MIEAAFPGLRDSRWQITSPQTPRYNCIGWAAGEETRWWWPDRMGLGFWPQSVPREETLDAFVSVFQSIGFEVCDSDELEAGIEKVAIYCRENVPKHAARQLDDGQWSSKLGPLEDIRHELASLTGATYGTVAVILMRQRQPAG